MVLSELLIMSDPTSTASSSGSPALWFPNIYFLGYKAGQGAHVLYHQGWPSGPQVLHFCYQFPSLYWNWWWELVASDPIHVMVETTLVLSIVIIVFRTRRSHDDWKKEHKLSVEEEHELLKEWKQSRAPLTPPIIEDYVEDDLVVHQCGKTLQVRRYDASAGAGAGNKGVGGGVKGDHNPTVGGSTGGGKDENEDDGELIEALNMATFDFLGMGSSLHVKDAAQAALDRYGCGSCGPRGFYGTVDVHLQLEEQMAQFWGTERAILYSDGASTCSSTIAAFCKRGDLLVVDDGVSEPLVTGVTLSRAHVKWFKHNDVNDLRRVLTQVATKDAQLGRPSNAQRRFIVVEGLYRTTGTICPLDQVVALKEEFAYRIILDESLALGVLGPTGRGVTELYGLKPMHHIEITTIGLEAAIGSIGGVTVGTEEVVEHQRLSGSGYCFSAAAPPFTAVAATTALQLLNDHPQRFLVPLGDNVVYLYEKLRTWCTDRIDGVLCVASDERSPIVVLHVADVPATEYLDEGVFCGEVARECLERGVAVCVGGRGQQTASHSVPQTPPSLRLALAAHHSHADVDKALSILAEAVDEVMGYFREESKQ